jgi:HEAT repeat protein
MHRRQYLRDQFSAVTRQHIDLFQGGQLSEGVVEAAKERFRGLLERGEVETVEANLRPGMHYVIHVRALAEIGSDAAGRILERQLQRHLTDDQLEQSWYWIDLASGLRNLNRTQSLPHLLRCSETAGDLPLGHFFAAEVVSFVGFNGYLHQPHSPLGRAALRTLHRALEGLRYGVGPDLLPEARLGEAVEQLWDHRPDQVNPLVVRIFVEALRQVRRAPLLRSALTDDAFDREAFEWQISRLAALEPMLVDYLQEAPLALGAGLARATRPVQADILRALDDLHAEAASVLLPLLEKPGFVHAELALRVLASSRDSRVGPFLRDWSLRHISPARRMEKRRRASPPVRSSVPAEIPYPAILRALRGHPSMETEEFLISAARDWDPVCRASAISSLGWWEPLQSTRVLGSLHEARHDPSGEVRQAARAALARLGERQALHGFRLALTSEDPQRVHEAVQLIASEGLTLLWPDLDHLADAEDPDIANHAREALEHMREDFIDRPQGDRS